jgi:hypothetical protein
MVVLESTACAIVRSGLNEFFLVVNFSVEMVKVFD